MAFICTFLIGAVLLFTGLVKSLYLQPFINHVEQFRIFSKKMSILVALFFVELECGLGVSLILHVYPQELIPFTFILILILSGLNIWANKSGKTDNCGCYGNLVLLAPWQTLLLNVLYLAILAVGWTTRIDGYSTELWKVWIVILSILISGYLAKQSVRSPLIDLSRLRKGARWQSKWVENSSFNSGIYLVAFMNNSCPICKKWIAELINLNQINGELKIVCIFPLESRVNGTINREIVPHFSRHFINNRLFQSLVFQVPTAVLLADGIVLEKWITDFPDI